MTRQLIISLSVAFSLLFTGIFSFSQSKGCFLPGIIPSPALGAERSGKSEIVIIEAEECEFSVRLIEWLREIF